MNNIPFPTHAPTPRRHKILRSRTARALLAVVMAQISCPPAHSGNTNRSGWKLNFPGVEIPPILTPKKNQNGSRPTETSTPGGFPIFNKGLIPEFNVDRLLKQLGGNFKPLKQADAFGFLSGGARGKDGKTLALVLAGTALAFYVTVQITESQKRQAEEDYRRRQAANPTGLPQPQPSVTTAPNSAPRSENATPNTSTPPRVVFVPVRTDTPSVNPNTGEPAKQQVIPIDIDTGQAVGDTVYGLPEVPADGSKIKVGSVEGTYVATQPSS